MISTDFAPNETWQDAFLSLKLLFQPWRWKTGPETDIVNSKILQLLKVSSFGLRVSGFLSGRAALYHLLKSLGLNRGDEVIVQAFTCEAVILPVLKAFLKPVYIDIEKKTFSMDPIDLERKITPKARVLILQYTFGLSPIYREKIKTIINKYNLVLIEDIAHGYNPKTQNSKLETRNKNHYYLVSFGRTKPFSSVFGGAIVGPNNETMKQLNNENKKLPYPSLLFIFRLLLYKPFAMVIKSTYDLQLGKILHGVVNKFNLLIPEITQKEKSGAYETLLDKRYPNALAILLLEQLKQFGITQARRSKIVKRYDKYFYSNFKPPRLREQVNSIPLLRYPLLVNNRNSLLKKAANNNIYLGKWYDQVVSPKSLPLDRVGYKPGSCPVAEEICQNIINLPTNISEKEAEKIVEVIKNI